MSESNENESLEDLLRDSDASWQAELDDAIAEDRSRGYVPIPYVATPEPVAPRGPIAAMFGIAALAVAVLVGIGLLVSSGGNDQPSDSVSVGAEVTSTATSVPESDPADEDSADSGSVSADDKSADGTACPQGTEQRQDACLVVGPPPTRDLVCPDGAVALDTQCYEIVEPSCDRLGLEPNDSGCLEPSPPVAVVSTCPDTYQLDDDVCVRFVPVAASCPEGTPVGDRCLVDQREAVSARGCTIDQLQLKDLCYTLSEPRAGCGPLAVLADGTCRLPVPGEPRTTCPDGQQPQEGVCYRYQPATGYQCLTGISAGSGQCRTVEPAVAGPESCRPGVLQDAQGCYLLSGVLADGSCGGLIEFDGRCRENMSPIKTWICPSGASANGSTCEYWTTAVGLTCAEGEPVDDAQNDNVCRTVIDSVTTSFCPDDVLEDSEGCYTSTPTEFGCGDREVSPDGERCLTAVQAAESATSCDDGYELQDQSCVRYIDATPGSCNDGEIQSDNGSPTCRSTVAPKETSACAADAIERAGTCFTVVPPGCGDLDVDPATSGCRTAVAKTAVLQCQDGFDLVNGECLKP